MTLAVEQDVRTDAARDVLLIAQLRQRLLRLQPRQRRFAQAHEDGRPIRFAFIGRDDWKLRSGHFLQITRQRLRRISLDPVRVRGRHDLVTRPPGFGECDGLAAVRLRQRRRHEEQKAGQQGKAIVGADWRGVRGTAGVGRFIGWGSGRRDLSGALPRGANLSRNAAGTVAA